MHDFTGVWCYEKWVESKIIKQIESEGKLFSYILSQSHMLRKKNRTKSFSKKLNKKIHWKKIEVHFLKCLALWPLNCQNFLCKVLREIGTQYLAILFSWQFSLHITKCIFQTLIQRKNDQKIEKKPAKTHEEGKQSRCKSQIQVWHAWMILLSNPKHSCTVLSSLRPFKFHTAVNSQTSLCINLTAR